MPLLNLILYEMKNVDELKISPEKLVEMYRTMVKIRLFEEMADKQYALGKVHGTMHLSAGQEAVAVGTGFAVRKGDYLLNHHRGHGHFIASGADVNRMMNHINSYKRKKLNDRSPYEAFSFYYGEELAHKLGCFPVIAGNILLKPSLLTK